MEKKTFVTKETKKEIKNSAKKKRKENLKKRGYLRLKTNQFESVTILYKDQ